MALYNKYYEDYYKNQYEHAKLYQNMEDIKFFYKRYKEFKKQTAIAEPIYVKMFRDYSKFSLRHKNILRNLTVSNKKNTFEEFWDNITELYKASGYSDISTKEYEEMRVTNALDAQYFSKIQYGVFPNCIVIHPLDNFELNDRFQVQLVCTKLTKYFTNLLNFINTKKYIIQDLGLPDHRISCVISRNEIAIIDPNSMLIESVESYIDNTNLFKCIDNTKIKTKNGLEYTIVCPQLHSMTNILTLLNVSSKRIGACTIVARMIPQVMIYMKIPALKAIQIITTEIVRKLLLHKSIVPFADGYTTFLYNIGSYRDTIPIMEDEKKPYIALVNKFFTKYGFSKPKLFSKNTDYFAVFMAQLNTNKFYRTDKPKNNKIYIHRNGLMPFKTYWPITSVPVKNMPVDTNGKLCLIPIIEKKNAKTLLNRELDAIRSVKNKHEVYKKIGEILYLKYGKENIDKYFKQKSYTNSQQVLYIKQICIFYIQELNALRSYAQYSHF